MKLFKNKKAESKGVMDAPPPTPHESLSVLHSLCRQMALSGDQHDVVKNHVENVRKALPDA